MGLYVSSDTNQINALGTPMEVSPIYVRIEYNAHLDGKTIDVKFQTYYDKSHYTSGQILTTDIPYNGFSFEILPTETQSLDTAFTYTINKFTEWGYSATLEVIN